MYRTSAANSAGREILPLVVRGPTDLVATLEDPAAIEGLWRSFQAEAVCSPFQRYEWVRSYVDAIATDAAYRVVVISIRDRSGEPLLILPLELRRNRWLVVASFVGGNHANFNLPLMASRSLAMIKPADLHGILLAAGEAAGIDLFAFMNQPLSWRGEPNLLVGIGGSPSVEKGYKLNLSSDAEKTIKRVFGGETRKKMRKKIRLLSEREPLRFWEPRTADEVANVLSAFFEQKQRRCRTSGISNPFVEPVSSFIHKGSLTDYKGDSAIELYALSIGDRILATFGGTGDQWRFCGMFNSFDMSDDISRYSPGELLLAYVIKRQCECGRAVFDLGVGKAAYKVAVCDEVEELLDVFLPVTHGGRILAFARKRELDCKRFIKRTPWAYRAATAPHSVRAALFRLSEGRIPARSTSRRLR